jgi:3-phosphoglycerate kinase
MLQNIETTDLKNKIILLRVDYNVPIENGKITDPYRIDATLPTIKYILEQNAKIVIISHLGRPFSSDDAKYSLKLIFQYLQTKFKDISFITDKIDHQLRTLIENDNNNLILLENIRYYPEETKNIVEFSKILASLADIYVNDAFSCSHRMHCSTFGIQEFLPSYAGLLLTKEINSLAKFYLGAQKPLTAIIGGAKISTKISLIKSLLNKVDKIIIGGAMANNFLKAKNISIGNSLYEESYLPITKEIINIAESKNIELILPIDYLTAKNPDNNDIIIYNNSDILDNNISIFDIGPKTIELFTKHIKTSNSIFWNGPMGFFEKQQFEQGTKEILLLLADLCQKNLLSIIAGGGDSVAAANKFNCAGHLTYLSTAGGAFLEWIENQSLPCL